MAELDAKVAAQYRALATEEPSAVLDDAIRAAARRAVHSAPGTRASRWAVPVSVAAVLVLSFGVVLRMQQEEPGIESSLPAGEAPAAKADAPPPAQPEPLPVEKPVTAPPAKPAPAPRERKQVAEGETPKPVAPAPVGANVAASPATTTMPAAPSGPPAVAGVRPPAAPPPAAAAPSPFPAAIEEARRDVPAPRAEPTITLGKERPAPLGAASAPARAKIEAMPAQAAAQDRAAEMPEKKVAAPETPEKKLERIAEMRAAGRHREADEALEKFRREHPDYKIAPEMWERVRPR